MSKSKTYRVLVKLEHGEVEGYGAPGYSWITGSYDNRVLFEFRGDRTEITLKAQKQRAAWEAKQWPSAEARKQALKRRPLQWSICSNCGKPAEGGVTSCLERLWCHRSACQEALETAKREYRSAQERRQQSDVIQSRAEQQQRVREIDEATKSFHWRDGWYFRRLADGSVRVMHRDASTSEWLKTDITIPAPEWTSIVCSVSALGEDRPRWDAAQDFHGRPT